MEAEELWSKRQGGGAEALSELRRSQGAGQARIQEEREGLIREFREAAMDLMDGVVEREEKTRAPLWPSGPTRAAQAPPRLLQGARGHHQKASIWGLGQRQSAAATEARPRRIGGPAQLPTKEEQCRGRAGQSRRLLLPLLLKRGHLSNGRSRRSSRSSP